MCNLCRHEAHALKALPERLDAKRSRALKEIAHFLGGKREKPEGGFDG